MGADYAVHNWSRTFATGGSGFRFGLMDNDKKKTFFACRPPNQRPFFYAGRAQYGGVRGAAGA